MKIRLLTKDDVTIYANYIVENREFLKPWQPKSEKRRSTKAEWNEIIQRNLARQKQGEAYYFLAVSAQSGEIMAHCNISQIFYGPFRACYMGYAVAEKFQGQGVMFKSCRFVVDYAFNELNLHRIMANYMPRNKRSAALLEKLGFVKEGLAKDYLEINGKWEDHVLTSLTNKNFRTFS